MDFGLKIVWFLNQICALIHLKGQLGFQSKSNSCKPKFSLALQVQESITYWWGIVCWDISVVVCVTALKPFHWAQHWGWDLGAGAQRTVSSASPAAVTAPKLRLGWPLAAHPSVLLRAFQQHPVRVLRSAPSSFHKCSWACLRKQPPNALICKSCRNTFASTGKQVNVTTHWYPARQIQWHVTVCPAFSRVQSIYLWKLPNIPYSSCIAFFHFFGNTSLGATH